MKVPAWHQTFELQLRGLPYYEALTREYRFHPPRRWRFDYAYAELALAVELEGGTWINGRHSRGAGFAADCEKYNMAQLDGWTVLRFTAKQVTSGESFAMLAHALPLLAALGKALIAKRANAAQYCLS